LRYPGLVEKVAYAASDQAVTRASLACGELQRDGPKALVVAIDMRPDQLLNEFGRCHGCS
jgi:hypothetical protein